MNSALTAPAGGMDSPPTAPNGWSWGLLEGFRKGQKDALRDVYRLYAEKIGAQLRFGFSFESRGRAHRFIGYGSAFDLQDALHETFRRAFEPRAREGYDGIRPYLPYLKTIARNVVLRSFRKREILFPAVADGDEGVPAVTAWGDEGPSPEQSVASGQVQAMVQRFLGTLATGDRRLLELRFIEGQSQRDVAASLGLGRQQVRGREDKLKGALVRFLRDQGESGWLPAATALAVLGLANGLAYGAADGLTRGLADALAEGWRIS